MNSWIPKEALNERQWVEEEESSHWVISPRTRFDSTGNNVALISGYSTTKKKPFVRRNDWIKSFSPLVVGRRLALTALVIKWMQDLGNHTVTAEETSLKYQCMICAPHALCQNHHTPLDPCSNALCTLKGHEGNDGKHQISSKLLL